MLEKIFTSKIRIKILEFLFFKKNESYIREISKDLDIPVSAVKREVDNLKSSGIIKSDKNRLFLNKECNFIGDLRSIFLKTDYLIYPLKDALNKKEIEFALIFGSLARGDYKEESDVDLLIIGDNKLVNIYKLLKPVEEKTKREINPVVWTIENLKKEKDSGFVKDIFNKKIIMIKGDEDEFRKIIR